MSNQAHVRLRGVLFVVAGGILWGTIGVAVNALYASTPATALSVLYYRFLFATPVLFALLFFREGRSGLRISRRALSAALVLGGTLAASQLCYFAAIRDTGVAVATLIAICVAPPLVAVISVYLFKEPLTRSVLLALGLSIAGVALLSDLESATSSYRGILLALGSAATFAVVILMGRVLAGHGRPLQVNAVAIGFGTLLLTPLAAPGLNVSFTLLGWSLLLYLGVVTTALSYWLFVAGVQTVSATEASVLTLVDPLVATLLAYLLFGERLGTAGLLGGGLLIVAFLLISLRKV